MFGKTAYNAKKVKAVHKDGREVIANSITELSRLVNISNNNITNLINKAIIGKKGWKVTLVEDIV